MGGLFPSFLKPPWGFSSVNLKKQCGPAYDTITNRYKGNLRYPFRAGLLLSTHSHVGTQLIVNECLSMVRLFNVKL